MPEDEDLAYLCKKKYDLLAKMRSEGLNSAETVDLYEIEARILSAQRGSLDNEDSGRFNLPESRLTREIKKLIK